MVFVQSSDLTVSIVIVFCQPTIKYTCLMHRIVTQELETRIFPKLCHFPATTSIDIDDIIDICQPSLTLKHAMYPKYLPDDKSLKSTCIFMYLYLDAGDAGS